MQYHRELYHTTSKKKNHNNIIRIIYNYSVLFSSLGNAGLVNLLKDLFFSRLKKAIVYFLFFISVTIFRWEGGNHPFPTAEFNMGH